ncbi:MAG: phosphoribosylformylglycinamidine synthase subunit PurQ [Ignavibacterium album]|uniref:phosphoribosylformylglycinamidine synthase subunit PurQ n=1 Tax=Ignavibacterium album TaxID=591197 RepID=UPI0026F0E451|nr:phosphoribosylformylglycinamidine synthase subunit PurQ [Ignavibacterium album]MBI5663252.1 phosphoribosylformylglycinamidine synthase subunit PurQ [Ignavibacterium album]
MKPKFGVVVFPGSNCDYDAYYAIKKILDQDVTFLWHKENNLDEANVIILPGGFSYGDYLRTGAIARFSPIMNSVIDFAHKGGIVIGICNGFQILLEAGLLPGVMLRNMSLQFVCKDVYLSTENRNTFFSNEIQIEKKAIKIPIAHGEGNYYASDDVLKSLQENNQIIFRYSDSSGKISDEVNPNGSLMNIAGIINKQGNVLGMMPHPERACDPVLNKTDGQFIFKSIINYLTN